MARTQTPAEFEREINALAKPLQNALAPILRRIGLKAVEDAIRAARTKALSKDAEEINRLLMTFGFRGAVDAARVTALGLGRKDAIPADLARDAMAGKGPPRIKVFQELIGWYEERAEDIADNLKESIRFSVQNLITDALEETPKPSVGEVARRIRTQSHGKDGGQIFGFAPNRAELIARTELGIARNTGRIAGYEAVGVKEIEWLAVTSDSRSGPRRHSEMNGKRVKLGKEFTLPSGVKMRFPHDPLGPISEKANCRCTVRAVR